MNRDRRDHWLAMALGSLVVLGVLAFALSLAGVWPWVWMTQSERLRLRTVLERTQQNDERLDHLEFEMDLVRNQLEQHEHPR